MAITAGVVGAGMLAAGTAAAIAAAKKKTGAREVQYGGSSGAGDALKLNFAAGADQGNADYSTATNRLLNTYRGAQDQQTAGRQIMGQANQITPGVYGNAGSALLNQYQPGQIAATQQQVALDQGALQNLGAGASGGALGLRNALNANAGANTTAAQNAAVMAAQEQQSLLGAKVAQGNTEQSAQLDQNALAQQQRAQLLGLGAQTMQGGLSTQAGAASNIGQLGLANQGQQLEQSQNVYDTQNANAVDYERRRQADQQRKSQNVWGLAQGLIGGGAKMLGGA